MLEKPSFGIRPEQIVIISIDIQESRPEIAWGTGELKNAIFETIANQQGLPFEGPCGSLDHDDPRISRLYSEFSRCYEESMNIIAIDEVEAKCKQKDCDWSHANQAKIEKADRALLECPLTDACREHHINTGMGNGHNHYSLIKNGEYIGNASVSRQVATGYIKPLE
ncbi:hypothetical protein ACFL15_02700 [Patescibacteria group bacterium]